MTLAPARISPGRRRAPLVLGDQRDAGRRERLGERAPLRAAAHLGLELGERLALATALDLLAGRLDDAVQDVHREPPFPARAPVSPTRRSSASAAAPESIAASAARTPASRVSARPPARIAAPALSTARSRCGPGSPARMRWVTFAFSGGVPPRTSSIWAPGEPHVGRRDLVGAQGAAVDLHDPRCARRAHLVQSVRARDYQRPRGAEARERARPSCRRSAGPRPR